MKSLSRLLCVLVIITYAGNVISDPLSSTGKLNLRTVEDLLHIIDDDANIFEINYCPVDQGTRLMDKFNEGRIDHYLIINGMFGVNQSVVTNQAIVNGGYISEWVPIKAIRSDRGSYRRLRPLMVLKSNIEAEGCFYLAVGEGVNLKISDLHFFGPFLVSEKEKFNKMIQMISIIKTKSPSTEINAREVFNKAEEKWMTFLGLVLLKQDNDITASDFVSNPAVFVNDDVTILNDLFFLATHTESITETLPNALFDLVRNEDSRVAENAMRHMVSLVEGNTYNARITLNKSSRLFEELESEVVSRNLSATNLLESIRLLGEAVK